MSNASYDAVCRDAWEIVNGCERAIRDSIESGETPDEDTLYDTIHEVTDNALIYTVDQYILVWGLKDEEDCIEGGLCSPKSALAAQAYCNLRAALSSIDYSDSFERAGKS